METEISVTLLCLYLMQHQQFFAIFLMLISSLFFNFLKLYNFIINLLLLKTEGSPCILQTWLYESDDLLDENVHLSS